MLKSLSNFHATVRLVTAAFLMFLGMPGISASACSTMQVHRIDADFRAECRDLALNQSDTIARLKDGRLKFAEIATIVQAIKEGRDNCQQNRDLAFSLMNAGLGSPIAQDANPKVAEQLVYLMRGRETVSDARRREVSLFAWLANSTFFQGMCGGGVFLNTIPDGWEREELRSELLVRKNWKLAYANFGNSPLRDRILFDTVADRTSPYYDLAKTTALAQQAGQPQMLLMAAESVTDVRFNDPEYEKAAHLLDWYSPYVDYGLAEEEVARAKALWTRIAQTRLSHSGAAVRDQALHFLQTGEPRSIRKMSNELSAVRVVDIWPEQMHPRNERALLRAITPHDYRNSWMRRKYAGALETAVLFGPDGKSQGLRVLRSSAPDQLDRATVRLLERRFRPRIEEMAIAGHEGTEVLVPFLTVKWKLALDDSEWTEGVTVEGRAISITARPRGFTTVEPN